MWVHIPFSIPSVFCILSSVGVVESDYVSFSAWALVVHQVRSIPVLSCWLFNVYLEQFEDIANLILVIVFGASRTRA